jgi:hypothetical protein
VLTDLYCSAQDVRGSVEDHRTNKERAMPNYIVNRQPQATGEHEVHETTCSHLPDINNQQHLGSFSTCMQAVVEARRHYTNVDGCFWCSRSCHTR